MAIAKTRYEQRSTLLALETYLTAAGWTGIKFDDGYQPEDQIVNPQVTVTFPPSRIKSLQMGRVAGKDKTYLRRMQIDVYMEDEPRTQTIIDDIMDFMDETCIFIKNESGVELGTLICDNSETIFGDTLPILTTNPKILQNRGVVRGEFEAFYPG
jgi:hypothetical protein